MYRHVSLGLARKTISATSSGDWLGGSGQLSFDGRPRPGRPVFLLPGVDVTPIVLHCSLPWTLDSFPCHPYSFAIQAFFLLRFRNPFSVSLSLFALLHGPQSSSRLLMWFGPPCERGALWSN